MDIQIKPIVTEKATAYSEKQNCYTFAVSPDANKFQIKDVVEKLYNVRVVKVNTALYAGKRKQRYTKRRAYQRPETFIQEGIRDRCRRTNDRLL